VGTGLAAALPLALGAAVSPGLLAIVLLILLSETRPKTRAWLYLLGVVTVILVGSFVGLVAIRSLVDTFGTPSTKWSVVLKMLTTLILFGLAWRSMRPSQTRSADRRPSIEARLKAARPPVFFIVGVATMLTNWSTLLLYLSALEVIRAATVSTAMTLVASGLALLITIGPLLLPVLAATVAGHRSDPFLSRVGQTAGRHAHEIIAAMYIGIAVLVAFSALNDVVSP
jgi:hypothetical protein